MGPGTTADFYKDINALAEAQGRSHRPSVLIDNVPLEYAVEQELLTNQSGLEMYTPYLVDSAQRLERSGSDFIAVPCNTVHELYDDFSDAVGIPVLHIVGETVGELQRRGVGSIALLATGQTINSKLYQGFLEEAEIECVVPDEGTQDRLNHIVANLVTATGAAAGEQSEDGRWLNGLVDNYISEIGTVVLGCTDFHIAQHGQTDAVIDSMHVLAEATVAKIYES